MNALFKYCGSKWTIAQWITAHFPPHKVYLEPFFCSGAVFFTKAPSPIETINDINGDVVNLFKMCRERPLELAAAIELTPYSREEFLYCANNRAEDPLERARRTLVRYEQCYGVSVKCSPHSWKNGQVASAPKVALQFAKLPAAIMEVAARLRIAQIENIDALALIERYDDFDTLIYCDPPYLPDTRKRGIYEYEMSDEGHRELLGLLKASKSKVVLSGYDSELYNRELSNWYTDTHIVQTQSAAKRVEKLYMNFQPSLLYYA